MRSANLFFAFGSAVVCSAAALAVSPSKVMLPKPTGVYQVGRSITELVDHSRTQPFAPDVEPRRLMISVFYPVSSQQPPTTGAYMPPETARFEDLELSGPPNGLATPNGTMEKVTLQLAGDEAAHNLTRGSGCHYPLVLFMPAEGTTRLFYNLIASTISSNGYTVVTIDTPYDVDIVEYTDGSVALLNGTLWNSPNQTVQVLTAELAVKTRVQDASFVLDSLSNSTLAHSLIPNLPQSGLNTTHTAMFGHSLGGAASFSILASDDRVMGGINMDSTLVGPVVQTGITKPFMIMAHANHVRENSDPLNSWVEAWPNVRGWKRDVIVAGTGHYDFSDYGVVFETLGVKAGKSVLLGSMKGTRALQVVTSYVGAFLDFVLYGKCSALLDGPVGEFPEVTFEY